MTQRTAYVVMRGNVPAFASDTAEAAQAAAIDADTEHLPAGQVREHRWDSTEWPVGALILKARGASTGRWVKTGYSVVPVSHVS